MSLAPTASEYSFICRLVYEHSRIDLGTDKRELVAARLGKRLRANGLDSFGDYCRLLQSPAGGKEIRNVVDVISTNHTHFFRELKHFEFLTETLLPDFDAEASLRGDKGLRCWSAAASSGEEPYSIAIAFAEHAAVYPAFRWTLEASDICTSVLDTARDGIYPEAKLADVHPDLLRRYFQRGTGKWREHCRVKESLRARLRWHHLNLFQEHYPFSEPFHLIFCRNVMIYFDTASQEELIAKLTRQLVPGGYLMIGHSESLTAVRHELQTIRPAIYRKAKN